MAQRINVIRNVDGKEIVVNAIERPRFSSFELKLLKLNKISIIRDLVFVKKIICRIYSIPLSTSFSKNFDLTRPILEVGENVGLNDTMLTGSGLIKIGDNCSFSHRNMIVSSIHNIDDFSKLTLKPVIIGNNVWITSNVTILGGVTIGDNTIIGAGSVVTHNIPSGVFAAGNPCRVIKEINFKK